MDASSSSVSQRLMGALALVALVIGLTFVSAPARAATLTVANTNDSGFGSLRQAILDANAGDTITFAPALSGQTITLTPGPLNITKDLTINGDLNNDGAPDITVSGHNASRVFKIYNSATVTLEGLTITGGNSPGGGGILAAGGTLTVIHSTVSGNEAVGPSGTGGGIYAAGGNLTVTHSVVSGNSVRDGRGGGIYAVGGTLTVTHSTVSGNSGGFGGSGGGIYVEGETLTVTNSTLASNSGAFNGGALTIIRSPNARVTSATFSGNSANVMGGAIFNADSNLTLSNVILWGNTAPNAPHIHNEASPTPAVTYSVVQGGYIGAGNIDRDPQFVDAAHDDFRLLPTSPAIDAGTNTGAPSDDIRGLPRPFNTTTDIGAYEWQGLVLSKSGGDNQSTPINTAFANPLTVTVSSAAPPTQTEPVTGTQVAFTAPASGSSAVLNPTSPVTVTCIGSPAICTASVNVTANGAAGTYTVSANAAGATTPITFGLTNSPTPVTVTLGNLGPHTYDGAPKSASCTTNPSGLATRLTYDGSTVPPTNAGGYAVVCTVTDPNHTGSASGTLTIAKANQSITFNPPASGTVGGSAVLSATGGGSGNPVTFVSQTGSVCTVSGSTVTYLAADTCTLTASQAGNANYNPAPDVSSGVQVGPSIAPVTLGNLSATYDGAPKSASCTTNPSGLATRLTYDGSTVPPTNAGGYAVVCTVTDPNHTGSASGTLTIAKANQSITFNPPASGTVGGSAVLSATGGGSGNPVTFVSQTGSVCTVSGSTVTYLAADTCTLTASQAGNANYNPAPDVHGSISVGAAQNTALASSANPSAFGQRVTFTATVSGQNPTGSVIFTADGGSIAGCGAVALAGGGNGPTAACATATLAGGTHQITAAYGGDANNPADVAVMQQQVRKDIFISPVGTATGTGEATVALSGGAACGFSEVAFVPLASVPAAPPAGYEFPHGLLAFALAGCTPGGIVTLTVTYPSVLPEGAVYWKYGRTPDRADTHWYQLPASISGSTVSFSITDGQLGDNDLTADGWIADPGGVAVPGRPVTEIPTLSEWTLLALLGALLSLGGWRLRRESV